jgi:hypothetical protein
MATAPTAADETLGVPLLDRRDDQVSNRSSGSQGPEERGQRGPIAEPSAGRRWQDRAFLSLIAAVQLAWLAALGFASYYLLS